jgi:hypothetical protein
LGGGGGAPKTQVCNIEKDSCHFLTNSLVSKHLLDNPITPMMYRLQQDHAETTAMVGLPPGVSVRQQRLR